MEERGRIRSVNALIGRAYWSALNVPLRRFRESTLRDLGRLIPFDGALWGTGEATADRFHSLTLIGLDKAFSRALERTRDVNPMFEALVQNPQTSVDLADLIPDERFYACDIYREVCEPFHVQRALGTCYCDPRSGLYSIVALLRSDRERRFSAREREQQQHIVFHLMNAMSLAYSAHLRQVSARGGDRSAAICDSRGICYDAQPSFRNLVGARFPDFDGIRLPFAVPDPAVRGSVREQGLRILAEPVGDLYSLQAWQEGPMDRLTDRERQIVSSVCSGLSYKEVARPLGIAPSTVSNHLYRVFDKLGVASRTELAKLVSQR